MKSIVSLATVCLCVAVPAGAAETQGKGVPIKVGDKAPDFEIVKPGQLKDGDPGLKLSDSRGKKNVLVAFFPKAFTAGCTAQMCGYRDDFSRFQSADTEVVAVSVDQQAESDRFKKEKQFPFYVVGDPEARVVNAYGAPLVDLPVGRVAKRSIFLVDKTGAIRYIDLAYDVEKGKAPLYEALAKLQEAKGSTRN